MRNKWLPFSISLGVLFIIGSCTAPSVAAKETIWWKDTNKQFIPNKQWTNLDLNGKTEIKHNKKSRALYCSQVHLDFAKTGKPKYVKLRFARHLADGKLDTTATTTWVLGKNAPDKWQGSVCWPISTVAPVSAQVKISGNSERWVSRIRQFKAWSPSSAFPEDVLSFS